MAMVSQDLVIEAGSGQSLSFLGYDATFKVHGDQTKGLLSAVEFVAHPGSFTPPHLHRKTDEVSYVLEGTLGFMIAEEEFQAGPGSIVIRPREVPHAFWNVSDRPARFLDVYTPAGFEEWFGVIARMVAEPQPPTLDSLMSVALQYDVVVLPELIPPLVAKYNLQMPA